MLLSVKKRQEYLKYLGYYKDKIDGIVGKNTKNAYKKLQNEYFVRKKDKDGIYGKNTDILLRNAYKVKKLTKNFKLNEFKCKCKGKYCTGFPSEINDNLLKYLQEVRDKYGSVNVTSGLRCKEWNKIQGGTTNSRHLKGKATDFTNKKICKNITNIRNFIDENIKLSKVNYIYTDSYGKSKTKTYYPRSKGMKKVIHFDVK